MEGPFLDPGIPDGERTVYRALVEGEQLGTGVLVVDHASENGRELYRQSVAVRAGGETEYDLVTTFRRRSGKIHAESYRLETRHGDSEPVAVEEGRFRQVRVPQWGGETQPYPRDLAPLLGSAVALRGLEFEPGFARSFSVWFANTIFWEFEANVEGSERIELPVGELDAWRVRVRPSLEQVDRALDKIVAGLLPPLVLHFAKDAPHRFLRFEFPTGPFRDNPQGLIEAIELGGG
jgi:uncharacterized protein DUF3108